MPSRSEIAVVILAGRPPTPALTQWVARFPPGNIKIPQPFGAEGFGVMVALWRNSICRDFLAHCKLPYLMMIDADAWPVAGSDAIIDARGDVVGVHAISRHGGRAHAAEGEVGGHCLRVSRHALQAMADCDAFDADRGWFAFPTQDRGTQIAACEDGYFCWLARQAGFRPTKVAPMGHLIPMVAIPDGPTEQRFEFPARLLQSMTTESGSILTGPSHRPNVTGEQPCESPV